MCRSIPRPRSVGGTRDDVSAVVDYWGYIALWNLGHDDTFLLNSSIDSSGGLKVIYDFI